MPINILMPALSPTMEKGNLAKWLKKEGDTVKSGDVIAEIETDKATMEVEAVDDGTIAKIMVPEGTQDVAVNDVIAVMAGEGEDVKAASSSSPLPSGERSPPKAAGEGGPPSKDSAPSPQPSPTRGEGAVSARLQPQANPSPQAMPLHREVGEGGSRSEPGEGAKQTQANGHARTFASPLAKRLAKDAGIAIDRIDGTGPHGRVIARDVTEAKSGKGLKAAPAASPAASAPASMSDKQIMAFYKEGNYEIIPHDGMRRTIAQRLTQSTQTIPHFYLTMDCNLDALMAAREQINAAAPNDKEKKPLYKLSVNDFVIKAMAVALQRVPNANVSWTEAGMLKHKTSDVGVAVAMPGGLITPIIRSAETQSLSAISNQMKDFAARARNRKLKPEEYQGGTTAVSNLGMFGIKDFTAVINPPHATILAVGAGEERAIVKNGKIEIANMMSVTLSCDHRAVDGALGAELLGSFKALIENPVMMMV